MTIENRGRCQKCSKKSQKICGQDGITYQNECELIEAGIFQKHRGTCEE